MVEILLVVAALVAIAGVVALFLIDVRGWLGRRSGREVFVHMDNDRTISGVLIRTASDGLILRGATYLESSTELGGEVFVPRTRVSFVQIRTEAP